MKRVLSPLFLICSVIPAMAHPAAHAQGITAAAESGFIHPFTGLDHILVMVAVGIWAVHLGGRALWMLPCSFVALMILGGVAGIGSPPQPLIEHGINASLLLLGASLCMAWKPSLPVALSVVALSGSFHGFAHTSEMPNGSLPLLFLVGMAVATALLHTAGILTATKFRRNSEAQPIRFGGFALLAYAAYVLIPWACRP